MCMYKELYRIDMEMVGLYKVLESMSSIAQLSDFILQKLKISYIRNALCFSFEPYDYNVENIYTRYV